MTKRGEATRDRIVHSLLGLQGGMSLRGLKEQVTQTDPAAALAMGWLPLKKLAEGAKVSPATALAHVRRMAEVGLIRRVESEHGPAYTAVPFFAGQWIDPIHGLHERWRTNVPVDWRFPLVGRVPDPDAQRFLLEWLDRADARSMLPKTISRFEPPDMPVRMQVAVYGSCARGDTGRKSDLDILMHMEAKWDGCDALVELAHTVALDHPRPLNIQAVDAQGFADLPHGLRANIRRDSKTVWSNDPDATFIESPLDPADAT